MFKLAKFVKSVEQGNFEYVENELEFARKSSIEALVNYQLTQEGLVEWRNEPVYVGYRPLFAAIYYDVWYTRWTMTPLLLMTGKVQLNVIWNNMTPLQYVEFVSELYNNWEKNDDKRSLRKIMVNHFKEALIFAEKKQNPPAAQSFLSSSSPSSSEKGNFEFANRTPLKLKPSRSSLESPSASVQVPLAGFLPLQTVDIGVEELQFNPNTSPSTSVGMNLGSPSENKKQNHQAAISPIAVNHSSHFSIALSPIPKSDVTLQETLMPISMPGQVNPDSTVSQIEGNHVPKAAARLKLSTTSIQEATGAMTTAETVGALNSSSSEKWVMERTVSVQPSIVGSTFSNGSSSAHLTRPNTAVANPTTTAPIAATTSCGCKIL